MNILQKIIRCICVVFIFQGVMAQPRIEREALVRRHNVIVAKADSLASLSVGNGKFAFTVDVTGLQTFPEAYARGIPLGTQSEWGWNSFTNTAGYKWEESLKEYMLNGRKVSYGVQWSEPERNKAAGNYFRQNPHRLQLGNLGFEFLKKDGTPAAISDITNIRQQLNLWTGEILSRFNLEDIPVEVITVAHQQNDVIAFQVNSPLVSAGRLKVRLRFPFPTNEFLDMGVNWKNPEKHRSAILASNANSATVEHVLDSARYFVSLSWSATAEVKEKQPHYFLVSPGKSGNSFSLSCRFSPAKITTPANFAGVRQNSLTAWKNFWSTGGIVDFSGSTDTRAKELERRIILSQYLTKIQCEGSYPPQETGLTYNSWFGKPHLEMHWWHGVHFPLWDRTGLLEKSLSWYLKVMPKAQGIAARQGYEGVRWQKMTDTSGNEAPSSVGAFLIWQQPHIIYLAELCYRDRKDPLILDRYKDLVFATADFMASYAMDHKENGKYILGKGLIPAQERFKPEETFNPTFELAYWHWALSTAQQWRERLNLGRQPAWDDVLTNLSPLPQANGVYLAAESAPDSYTNEVFMTDHPAVLMTYGMLPRNSMLDTATMLRTFNLVWEKWVWKDTWGWDFPMVAMTATRLGLPEKAIDALLMDIRTNTYLVNGHNYQDERLRLYLPGNGGLLAAIALMCAGWDGCTTKDPGIPKNGKWKVRWEGLKAMP